MSWNAISSSFFNAAKGINQDLLDEFRKRLSDVITDKVTDHELSKWLKAGNLCLKKSEYIFRENLATRTLHDMDNIVKNFKKPEILEKYEFITPLGTTKDGTPLTYIAMGRGDFMGIIKSVNSWEIPKYCSTCFERDMERSREQSLKFGREIDGATYIIDMEEFSLKQTAHTEILEMSFDLFRMMQDHFPERWKLLLVVNAASYVYYAFNIIKPILRNFVLQNIHVASKEETPGLLLKYVDDDVLPAFLGGRRTDSKGDPMCHEFIKFGGLVPEQYHYKLGPQLLPTEEGVVRTWIRPRCLYNHSVVVSVPNSRISIEMQTEGGSIAVAILLRDLGPDNSVPDIPPLHDYLNERDPKSNVRLISPSVKIQAHLFPVDSYLTVPWKGLYIFRFDNSLNWLSGRTLIFRIQVQPPSS